MPRVDTPLGCFLRDRRTRLDPASFGFAPGRRRTPGLRREEVALRANISPTWYTWLEQGRGGTPSVDVIERIAKGLLLTEPEREHLHVLAFGRPPGQKFQAQNEITPRLQRVLDAMPLSPAIIINATWDVLAWNRAATLILADYSLLAPRERNILRLVFSERGQRRNSEDWHSVARDLVGAFRADATRVGANAEVTALVEELSGLSPVFAELWAENTVIGHGDGSKRLHHEQLGRIEMDFASFTVEGRRDLTMMVYTPATEADGERIGRYLA